MIRSTWQAAALGAALALQACTLAHGSALKDTPYGLAQGLEQEPTQPTVSLFYVPALIVEADVDENEPNMGVEFDADLDTGSGWGVRGMLAGESTGLGGMFMTTEHDEESLGGDVRTYSAYLEYLFGTTMGTGDVRFRPLFGVGLGAAIFDFDTGFDDTGSAAGQARIGFELELWERAVFSVGGAGFLWGYPGETIGYGAYATVELGIRF